MGVVYMEVDKVADEVTNMEVDKVTNMMAEFATNASYLTAKCLTNEEFFGVTLAKIITNASGATWWPNFQLMEVVPPGG